TTGTTQTSVPAARPGSFLAHSAVTPESTPMPSPLVRLLPVALVAAAAVAAGSAKEKAPARWPDTLIGYSHLRTDLPGGRHANGITMRARGVKADGPGRRGLAEDLTRESYTSTQFVGWSPDGRLAVIGRGWESAENGKWEEEHQNFRFDAANYLYDSY